MLTVAGELDVAQVEDALRDILDSSSFRSSKQCQALLRYVVTNTLAHHEEWLRERVIGANVFGRTPDYDTGNDPIVRSRAAEVRKRLAQYYVHADSSISLRIDIPSGSYRATFEIVDHPLARPEAPTEEIPTPGIPAPEDLPAADPKLVEPAAPQSGRSRLIWWVVGVALALIGSAMLALWLPHRFENANEREFRRFWEPVVESRRPVVIYIGANYSYRLTTRFLDEYRRRHGLENTGPEFFIDLKAGEKVDESDLIPDNRLIGFGDVASAGRIISTLARLNKGYDLRYGNDISISDLHASPAVLIGGFSNVWTLEVTRNLRFTLEQGDRIVDRENPGKFWLRSSNSETGAQEDYAVISRVPNSETGDFVLTIGGIDTFSNQAAADFLSDPGRLGALLRTIPAGWEGRNLQILLHTSAVKEVPAAANIEAVSY